MKATRIDHIAVAVKDLEAAVETYRHNFDLQNVSAGEVPSLGIRNAFLQIGSAQIELITPTSATGPVAEFLEQQRGRDVSLVAGGRGHGRGRIASKGGGCTGQDRRRLDRTAPGLRQPEIDARRAVAANRTARRVPNLRSPLSEGRDVLEAQGSQDPPGIRLEHWQVFRLCVLKELECVGYRGIVYNEMARDAGELFDSALQRGAA